LDTSALRHGARSSEYSGVCTQCYYALGDKDRMKKAFLHLMSIEHEGNAEEDEEEVEEDPGVHKDGLKEEVSLEQLRAVSLKAVQCPAV
jgi:hypothetical protein